MRLGKKTIQYQSMIINNYKKFKYNKEIILAITQAKDFMN